APDAALARPLSERDRGGAARARDLGSAFPARPSGQCIARGRAVNTACESTYGSAALNANIAGICPLVEPGAHFAVDIHHRVMVCAVDELPHRTFTARNLATADIRGAGQVQRVSVPAPARVVHGTEAVGVVFLRTFIDRA